MSACGLDANSMPFPTTWCRSHGEGLPLLPLERCPTEDAVALYDYLLNLGLTKLNIAVPDY